MLSEKKGKREKNYSKISPTHNRKLQLASIFAQQSEQTNVQQSESSEKDEKHFCQKNTKHQLQLIKHAHCSTCPSGYKRMFVCI